MNNAAHRLNKEDPKIMEAADWLLRLSDERVNGQQVEEWRQWLATSPDNRLAFERAQAVWDAVPRIPDIPWPTDREVARDIGYRWKRTSSLAAGVAALTIGAFIAWRFELAPRQVITTAVGENRSFTLADGSDVALGGASQARIAFTDRTRAVELQSGEAFFDVRKDAHRPFTVRAGEMTITAIGTAFNVRRAADRVQVAVTEGAVKVATNDSETRVDAGRQATFEAGSLLPPAPMEVPAVLARREGRLQYTSEPLRYVVADLSRYSEVPIEIGSGPAGNLLVTGTVLENDLQGWLQGLEKALPVQVHSQNGRIRIDAR